jgi:hypothetical protein
MPRVEDSGGVGGGYRLPGVYQALTDWARESAAQPDPRERLRPDFDPQAPQEPDPHSFALPILNRLEAGRPVTVPRWMIGGHSIPAPKDVPMLRDRTMTRFTVHPDDTITPVEDCDAAG